MKSYEEKKDDMQQVCEALKKLDRNGKAIAIGAINCMLARQQMEEQKEAG